jgi:hypothetical protein
MAGITEVRSVSSPATVHTITVAQLQGWVAGSAKSPEKRMRRERMRRLSSNRHPGATV